MFIKTVGITNFKSFKNETHVSFQEGLNLIVGPNSGGKSNLLELVQGFFNDVFLYDASFEQNNQSNQSSQIKPFKATQINYNENHMRRVFDKHVSNLDGNSQFKISLGITSKDITNIREFESISTELEDFETQQIGSNFIHQIKKDVDFTTSFEQFANTDLPLIFAGGNGISISDEIVTTDLKSLLHFLRWSMVIFKLCHLCKLFNSSFQANVRPYFYYLPPDRDFSLTQNEFIVDLAQINQGSTNMFGQRTQTQESRMNSLSILTTVLAENHFYMGENNQENNDFKKILNKYLKMDLTIQRHGLRAENKFKIIFSRSNGTSWKLSSGEREFFNLISTVYAHNLISGIMTIDEPEIHLHPKWQHAFLDLLKKISHDREIQVISVTHSASFIRKDVLSNVVRVSMVGDASTVLLPDLTQTKKTTTKDQFMLITASNNERIFFADKIILVEGYADRIIFESILDKVYGQDKPTIEIVDVLGKGNFERYKRFLEIWKIPTFIIADLDYLPQIDNQAKIEIFEPNPIKMGKSVCEKNSRDGDSLLEKLSVFCSKEQKKISKEELTDLCNLRSYLEVRHSSLCATATQEKINQYVNKHKASGIYVLSKGEVEDYFPGYAKFDIDSAINMGEKIRGNEVTADAELVTIITEISTNS